MQSGGVKIMSNIYGSSIYEYQPIYGMKECPNLDDYDMNSSIDDENDDLYEMYSGYSRSKKYRNKRYESDTKEIMY